MVAFNSQHPLSALPQAGSSMSVMIFLVLIIQTVDSEFAHAARKFPTDLTGPVVSNSGPWIANSNDSFSPKMAQVVNHQIVKRSFYPNPSPSLIAAKPLSTEQANFVLQQHNWLRTFISSTNMQKMHWDDSLAATAQSYAEQCNFHHSQGRVGSGENIWAGPFEDIGGAVRMWFDEVTIKECACGNTYSHCCGHFTQLAWAETNRLGCGFAQCSNVAYAPWEEHYVLICHYSPAGNVVYIGSNGEMIGVPGFAWTRPDKGACSECPVGSVCDSGLCDLSPSG